MEKTRIVFCSSKDDDSTEMEAFVNTNNELYIKIEIDDTMFGYITLNKQTAIKFVKHLKREISYIMESEVKNG